MFDKITDEEINEILREEQEQKDVYFEDKGGWL